MKRGSLILSPTLINIPLTSNKNLEIEISKGFDWSIFDFSFRWTQKVDHAGAKFQFRIWKLFCFEIKIYDHRHWNDKENRWCLPNEF